MNSILGALAFSFIIINFVSGTDEDPLFEGDIILSKYETDHLDAFLNGTLYTGLTRNAIAHSSKRWPLGVVPYAFKAVSVKVQNVFHQAIAEYHKNTCIRFKPRSNEWNYIEIIQGRGCYSYVGMVGKNGNQPVSIGQNCEEKGIIIHELMHAIGFWHEQSRTDRDEYIKINHGNIISGMEKMFQKHHGVTFEEDYDYCSIMHYGEYAFSKNGEEPTIVPLKDTNCPGGTVGQRIGFTDLDVRKINKVYKCVDGGRESTTTTTTTKTPTDTCVDNVESCIWWAESGFCQKYAEYMLKNCAKSCKACERITTPKCKNKKKSCDTWAKKGHCNKKKHFMRKKCKKSCGLC